MLTDHDERFFHRLSRLQRLYARALDRRLAPIGVKPGYLDILARLWRKDGIPQKELHAVLDMEQATLSNSLKRMERDGLLTRKRSPKDRRLTHITLTGLGRGMEKTVKATLADVQETAVQGLTVNDRRYFYRILKQMSEHLESSNDDAPLILVDEIME